MCQLYVSHYTFNHSLFEVLVGGCQLVTLFPETRFNDWLNPGRLGDRDECARQEHEQPLGPSRLDVD